MDGVKIVTPQEQGWTKVFSALFLRIVSRCHRAGRFGPGFSGGGDGAQRKRSAGIRQLRIRLPECGRNLPPGGFATLRR